MIRALVLLTLVLSTGPPAQQALGQSTDAAPSGSSSTASAHEVKTAATAALPDPPSPVVQSKTQDYDGKQTRRILGIVPNFRSVSVDEKLPPLSSRDKFKLMLDDSFDYSSFIYVGMLAGVSQIENSYPEFHHGAPAFARYYWHNFADTVDGNLMTEFIFPVTTKEDPRYYTLGHGGFFKRTGYSVSRLFVTRTDNDGLAPNLSEIVGNGSAAGISNLYYPGQERTWTKTGQRWAAQVGLDGVSNLLKEFWPDLNSRFFHNKY